MPTRSELKTLIEQLPDDTLSQVHRMLQFSISPPAPRPEMEGMQRRNKEYRQAVEEHFRLSRRPGTLGMGSGSGFASMHEGRPFSRQGFHYWDDKALVHQSLQSLDGQEIEVMERLSFSPDRKTLVCVMELSSGGHTVRHRDEFPLP